MANKNVGIDLGSTYSSIATYVEGRGVEAMYVDVAKPPSIPSVVSLEDGVFEFGDDAKQNVGDEDCQVFEAFKMLLVMDDPEALAQKGYDEVHTPAKITEEFLRQILKKIKSNEMGQDDRFEKVYICVPEVWRKDLDYCDGRVILRDILLQDVNGTEDIKIDTVKVVTEPEAASAYFAKNYEEVTKSKFNGHLLLIDYGGGTLDLTWTQVLSQQNDIMEIVCRDRAGAGENHKDEKTGKFQLGCAGIEFMRTVIAYALEEGGVPFDTDSIEFAKAVKDLESKLKGITYMEMIQECFAEYDDYEQMQLVLDEDKKVLCQIKCGKKVEVTCQQLYRAYRDVVEQVMARELDKICNKIAGALGIDPRDPKTQNRSDFKIAMVGGFSSFHLVKKQIEHIFGVVDIVDDDRFKAMDARERELAISYGAALLANDKVRYRKIARQSIGIVTRDQSEAHDLVVTYGLKYQEEVDTSRVNWLMNANGNPITYSGTISGNFQYFIVEESERIDHGVKLALKQEIIDRIDQVTSDGFMWHIGFTMDDDEIIHLCFQDANKKDNQHDISLDTFKNTFEMRAGKIILELVNGKWRERRCD